MRKDGRKLLVETFSFTPSKELNEASIMPTSKNIIQGENSEKMVTGIIQRAEFRNHNGRIYPKHVLKKALQEYINVEVKENRAYGELDHPDSEIINLKNTSHIIRKIWWVGNDVYATIELLDTPSGLIVQQLFKAKTTVGISSRGLGSVETVSEDTLEVQDDLGMIAWDFVGNPSTQGAFMQPVNENKSSSQIVGKLLENILK